MTLFRRFRHALTAFWCAIRGGTVIYNAKFTAASIEINQPYTFICNNNFDIDDKQRFCTLEELKNIYANCSCPYVKTAVMAKLLGGKEQNENIFSH